MKTAVAFLCLGLALASRPPADINDYKQKDGVHQDTSYQPGKLYRYFYDSQLLHGIPTASSQRSGQRIQAVVEAFAQSPTKMVVQLRQVSFGAVNERLHGDAESRILRTDVFEPATVQEDQKRHLQAPVVFKREHGLITALKYAQDEPEWTLNLKRSILSLLSHNLEAHAVQTPKEVYCPRSGECSKPAEQTTEDMRYYQSYETTVEGNCETSYSLVQNPSGEEDSVWNVTKAINLARCQQPHGSMYGRPEIRYNFHLSDACPQCDYKGKMLNSSTLLSINVLGERSNYIVERAQAISEYYIPDMTDDQKVTYRAKVNQSLILIEVEQKEAPQPASQGEQLGHSLMYSLNWDALKEKFFMDGSEDFLSQSPYSKFLDEPVTLAVKMLKQLVRELHADAPEQAPQPESTQTFLRLVRVMRLMKESDFESLHAKVYEAELSDVQEGGKWVAKDIVHSAMGAAGTFPAMKHIVKCINEGKIHQREATNAIRQLQSARVVSREAVELFEQLYKQIDAAEKPALKQVALLTYGSLARTFCMPRENKLAVEAPLNNEARSARSRAFCSKDDRAAIVKSVMQYFDDNQDSWVARLTAIKALANAGLPESVPEIRKIVLNKDIAEPIRVEAVQALRTLKSVIPEQIIAVLMPIIQDREMEPAVRMSAVSIVLRCKPNLVQMSQLAGQVNTKEDSRQVKSFIYTHLSSLANSTTNPCERQQAEQARQVLHLIRDDEKVIAGSFVSRSSFFNKETQSNYGAVSELYSSMSNESALPAAAGINLICNMGGFAFEEIFSLQYAGQGIDKAIVKYLAQYWEAPIRAKRSNQLAEDIRKQLSDLTANYESFNSEDAKLFASMRVMGQEVGFLPLDKSIAQTVRNYFTAEKLQSLYKQINMNVISALPELMYKIPTAMGLPLVVRSQGAVLAQVKGSVEKVNQEGYFVKNAKILSTLLNRNEINCEVWSPIVNTGLKMQEVHRAVLPIRGSLKHNGELDIEMPSRSEKELMSRKSDAQTFMRKWWSAEANTYVNAAVRPIHSEEHGRFYTRNYRSTNILGVEFEAKITNSPNTIEGTWNSPLTIAKMGPQDIHIFARKAEGETCDNLRLTLKKPTSKWSSSPHELKIENFKLSESLSSSEEASRESEDFTTTQKNQLFIREAKIEATCGAKKTLDLKYIESADNRLRKVSAEWKHGELKKYCAVGEVFYPETPMTPEQATGKTYSRLVYAWNGDCEGKKDTQRVQITMQSENSRAKADMERDFQDQHQRCLSKESPVACFDIVKQAAWPNKHTVQVKYDAAMPRLYKNATQKALQYFLAQHYMNADINKYEKSNANEINAVIRVDPRTSSRVNVTIQEPGQKIQMKDINSCLFNWEAAMLSQVVKPSSYSARCTVSDSHIETFDQAVFRAPVTDCWSVLAKDCSQESRFAVLMKRVTMGSPQKTLAVVTKIQKIEISNTLAIKVNGAEKQLTEQTERFSDDVIIHKYAGQKIKVSLPKQRIAVYFDGQAAKVSVNAMYFTEQCGLCGHYNRDARDIFRSPLSQRHSSIVEFFKQYQIEVEGCQKEPQQAQDYNFGRFVHSRDHRQPREAAPIDRIVGRHIDGQFCISKEKKPQCPIGYHASQSTKEQVQLHCITDPSKARELARRVQHQATVIQLNRDFEGRTESVPLTIPSKCKRV